MEEKKRGNPNWKKGTSANPNGKPKGAIGKKTEKWNMLTDYLLNEGIDRYISAINNLNDEDYVKHFGQILNYVKPKLSNIDQSNSGHLNIVITNEQEYDDSEDTTSNSA